MAAADDVDSLDYVCWPVYFLLNSSVPNELTHLSPFGFVCPAVLRLTVRSELKLLLLGRDPKTTIDHYDTTQDSAKNDDLTTTSESKHWIVLTCDLLKAA